MEFAQRQEEYIRVCEAALQSAAHEVLNRDSVVSKAAQYSLMGGGKRVRGVFVLAVCDMLSGPQTTAQRYAAAIEMMHAFSLIHDDLPCMDDDDLRRGRPACHKAYGEANALLAGDLLAIQAFEVLANTRDTQPQHALAAVLALSRAAGARGMIYGQELDLYYEQHPAGEAQLLETHSHKTGALFRAGIELGILAAGQSPAEHKALLGYADNIGYAFQVIDDILDVTSSNEVLGKPVGSDAEQGKQTFITLHGLGPARDYAQTLTGSAIALVRDQYGPAADFLCDFAQELAERAH